MDLLTGSCPENFLHLTIENHHQGVGVARCTEAGHESLRNTILLAPRSIGHFLVISLHHQAE